MTRNRDFKTLVRQRMAKTGERYSTARAHVLAARSQGRPADGLPSGVKAAGPSLFPSVVAVGGQQGDLAAAGNLCSNAGVVGPDGGPMSEAMAFGLAGGVGFLYGVFEYGDTPTMTIVARNQSMPDPFCEQLFSTLKLRFDVSTTGGAIKAAAALDAALDARQPALCTVGAGGLPYLGLPESDASMSPHLVGVVGVTDDGDLLIDDRSPDPIRVERAAFDIARALHKQTKHRMVTVIPPNEPETLAIDWPVTVSAAVASAVEGFDAPPVPQFKSNVGLAGLAKWQELLTSSTKKGWPTVFGSDRRAAIGLTRLYDCINYTYTAPDAGRPLFAQFLRDASELTGRAEWAEVAELWEQSGRSWRSVSDDVVSAHDDIERYCRLSDQRADALDTGRQTDMVALSDEQEEILPNFKLGPDEAADVYRRLAATVGTIIELETEGLNRLRST